MDPQEYFESQIPPSNLSEVSERVDSFVNNHFKKRKIVLVTSGGTTVPLENQTVRFLDNFSAGTRGATSAEFFLDAGYAVIFLHRQFSLQPYSRHYSHSKNCFLDYMKINEKGEVHVEQKWNLNMKEVLVKYQNAKKLGTLIMIDFVTVKDYLFTLRSVTKILSKLKKDAMLYLAAAVSDFFVPDKKMVEHKIQSDDGPLDLRLDKVPKILSPLVKEWAPNSFVVSFKLETDESILVKKSKKSLKTYGHHIVIGNILTTRKKQVIFVYPEEDKPILEVTLNEEELKNGTEIESKIIPKLVEGHNMFRIE
ncbi:hypothetical protein HK099_004877 [Clydaea vesicula]|uniref:DNA/pantothenate metabolism flavoprotein C-terminal domain-containing protein n=1 Tax=Clydaea vesicula TaxID=447962 RepID=A0AAD5U6V3_9FUNG|nr:hypothetical protein HK099_004877 [Clydaea vesicula]KAJ3391209.1 hypothetical protein HDU92_009164 [Lobulomyces angularis]